MKVEETRRSGRGVAYDVHPLKASYVEPRSLRQIGEGGARQAVASLTLQHRVELLAQRMEIQHVGGGVGQLRLAQSLRAPVGRLLLLGDLDAEQLARQVLEAVTIGVGARQLGGDLGAVDGRGQRTEGVPEHRDVEPAEMK